MPESGDEKDIGIGRIDEDFPDLLTVLKPDRLPAFSPIVGAKHSNALGNVASHVGFTASDVDPVGIRSRDGNGSNRPNVHFVENRLPRPACIVGSPNASVYRPEIELSGIRRITFHRQDLPSTERADGTPMKVLKKMRIDGRRLCSDCEADDRQSEQMKAVHSHAHSRALQRFAAIGRERNGCARTARRADLRQGHARCGWSGIVRIRVTGSRPFC